MELETINKLYLELSQVATAKTEREIRLERKAQAVDWEQDAQVRRLKTCEEAWLGVCNVLNGDEKTNSTCGKPFGEIVRDRVAELLEQSRHGVDADGWRAVAKAFWCHLDKYGVVAEIKSGVHQPLTASDPEWASQDHCFQLYHAMVVKVTNESTPDTASA